MKWNVWLLKEKKSKMNLFILGCSVGILFSFSCGFTDINSVFYFFFQGVYIFIFLSIFMSLSINWLIVRFCVITEVGGDSGMSVLFFVVVSVVVVVGSFCFFFSFFLFFLSLMDVDFLFFSADYLMSVYVFLFFELIPAVFGAGSVLVLLNGIKIMGKMENFSISFKKFFFKDYLIFKFLLFMYE